MSRLIVFDAFLPFLAVIVFCVWQLWALRRTRSTTAVSSTNASSRPSLAASADATHFTSDIAQGQPYMTDVRKVAWDDVTLEQLNPLIGRRLITSERMMLAHVYLSKGAIVPAHEHHNEQFTYIISGRLRFWIGEDADAPADRYTDVGAGEVLVIPSMVRHRAEALEDTLDVDVFDPPRQDWLDGSDAYLRAAK